MINITDAVDLLRNAILMTLIIVGPILLIGMAIGLIISLVQAVTQIQEQTLSFVPKLVAMAVALAIVAPWMLQRLVEYTRHLLTNISQ